MTGARKKERVEKNVGGSGWEKTEKPFKMSLHWLRWMDPQKVEKADALEWVEKFRFQYRNATFIIIVWKQIIVTSIIVWKHSIA
jgi:hypothetical protein